MLWLKCTTNKKKRVKPRVGPIPEPRGILDRIIEKHVYDTAERPHYEESSSAFGSSNPEYASSYQSESGISTSDPGV